MFAKFYPHQLFQYSTFAHFLTHWQPDRDDAMLNATGAEHRRWIQTEEKVKVVAVVLGT